MNVDGLLDGLDDNTFKDNFKLVVDLCGVNQARDLIKNVGGIQIYIPKVNSSELLKKYVEKRYKEFSPDEWTKTQVMYKLVLETGTTEPTIYRILNSLFKQGILKDHFKKPNGDDDSVNMFEDND